MKEPEDVGGSKQEREEKSWKMPWTTSKSNWPFDAYGQVCPAGALMLRTWSRRGSWPFLKLFGDGCQRVQSILWPGIRSKT